LPDGDEKASERRGEGIAGSGHRLLATTSPSVLAFSTAVVATGGSGGEGRRMATATLPSVLVFSVVAARSGLPQAAAAVLLRLHQGRGGRRWSEATGGEGSRGGGDATTTSTNSGRHLAAEMRREGRMEEEWSMEREEAGWIRTKSGVWALGSARLGCLFP
jgi:hypothetical protein